ncbi:MAG: arginine--tRNA ligase [Hadesarchaea archaeon]|nr:arginine--tRNA ligase [Hadesarchaea archaeon]
MRALSNPWRKFKEDALKVLKEAHTKLGWPWGELEVTLEEPPDPEFGDLASTVCFELAGKLREAPARLAKRLAEAAEPAGLVAGAEASNGYVNFRCDLAELARLTIKAIERMGDRYGHLPLGGGEKVLIEHTSVNPTKPLHIGHGRNSVIGDTVARILRALGYRVEVQNYIDDMGLQVAETLLAYRMAKEKPKGKFDHVLGKLYVDIHDRMKSEPKLEGEVRKILAELEMGGNRTSREARRMAERCVRSNLETTDRLNVSYDLLVWESDIARSGMLEETLNHLRRTPYLVRGKGKHDGALVLCLKEFGLEDKVLVRSDGTAVYTARDLAYQLWKFGKVGAELRFKPHSKRPDGTQTYTTSPDGEPRKKFGRASKVINVVGVEQRFPQRVVFTALRALGFQREYENSHHLAYGHVRLPGGKFSGRSGTWMGYSVDEVVDEAVARARAEVEKRNIGASESFKSRAAEEVGVGAVRYSLIRTSPEKEIVFKWEEALNFERNSGPAIQYSHARASSILRKVKMKGGRHRWDVFKLPEEQQLVKQLAKFPEVVKLAGEKLQPHLLALYAADLSLSFNKFYEVAPVIGAENEELKTARLRLVNCTRIVIRNALDLLGIKAPERM